MFRANDVGWPYCYYTCNCYFSFFCWSIKKNDVHKNEVQHQEKKVKNKTEKATTVKQQKRENTNNKKGVKKQQKSEKKKVSIQFAW